MQVEGVGFQLSWVRSRDVQRLMPNLASAWEFPTFGTAASRGMPLLACVRKLPSRLYIYTYIYMVPPPPKTYFLALSRICTVPIRNNLCTYVLYGTPLVSLPPKPCFHSISISYCIYIYLKRFLIYFYVYIYIVG